MWKKCNGNVVTPVFKSYPEMNPFSSQQGPLTDDMVTTYSNYVLLYSLKNVVKEVATCVFYL